MVKILTIVVGNIGACQVAEAVVVQRCFGMQIHWFVIIYFKQLLERFVDEDDRDQHCKTLLSKTCYVPHKGAQVKCNHNK